MPLLSGITGFFDKYILGYALGTAAGPSLEPFVQDLANDAWKLNQVLPLDAAVAAAIEAQAYTGALDGAGDASETGISGDRYAALKFLASTAPGTAELLDLWRRGKISEGLVRDGLKKGGLLDEFVGPVLELFTGRLDPAVIATAIQRGIMADPGFLPVGPPTATGKVPAFPTSPLDPLLEAQAHGIDRDRLFVETAIVGLPLSLQQAASALFRGIIELADFERAVAEGNTRNEWGPAALEQARQILTAAEYCELELRGFITATERRTLTGLHGMSDADSDRLFDVLGRAPAVHAVTTGLARGGTFNGPTADIPEVYLSAMQRSNARPEWYSIDYANRYSYPSLFVLRALLTDGVFTEAEAAQILKETGLRPDLADKIAAHYAPTGAGSPDPHVKKAQGTLWTEAHKAYVKVGLSVAQVTPAFDLIGIPAAAQTEIVGLWDAEKALASDVPPPLP